MALAAGFVLLVEGALRLFGFGGYPSTIVRKVHTPQGEVCITDTPGPASYFYANRSKPGANDQYDFLDPKPAGTVRIFLGGESAMKGFPQPMAFSPAAFLTAMLSDVWPERRVEVINLGTTAVASFPVLGMVTEALDYEPNLVVVHCGHNEFYGAYGVASLHSAGNRPWALALNRTLRSTAIMQAVDRVIGGASVGAPDKTLMEVMVGQSYLAPDSPIREAAARNLGYHIAEIIERCEARGVSVLVCTQPSNERDLAPLGSEDLSTLSGEAQQRVGQLMKAGEGKLLTSAAGAAEDFAAVIAIYPDHARAHFLLGKALLAANKPAEAAEHFRRAIDLDPMPWRAPSLSMKAVRAAAEGGGAWLCDAQKSFREASPGGCIGWELMDDHVHPTLVGQAQLARAIVETLTHVSGPLAVSRAAYEKLATNEAYAQRMGDNMYDRYGVAHTIRVLYKIPFFQQTNPEAYERFDRVVREMEAKMEPDVRRVCQEWQKPQTHAGAHRPITSMVGRAMIRMQRFADAEKLYDVARRCVARYSSWSLEYVYFQLMCRERVAGKLSEAERGTAQEAIDRGKLLLTSGQSRSGMAERYVGRLLQLRGEWAEATPYLLTARPKMSGTDLVAVDQALVMSYTKTGKRAEAVKLIEDGIAHSGEYAGMYQAMKQGLGE